MPNTPEGPHAPGPDGSEVVPGEVARARDFCARNDLPGVIDVHTHFMPQNVLTKVWAHFDRRGTGDDAGPRWPITYRLAEDQRVATLRALGVRRFTSLVYPHRPDMAAWLNDWAADFAARTPDCAHSATFYPEESAPAYVAAALDAGARVFKSHVRIGDYDPADPQLDAVWGLLAEAGVPTVIHCGSGPDAGRFTRPEPVVEVLRRHPRLRLVIAHAGMPDYATYLDLAELHDGVVLDTCMVFTDFVEAQLPFPRDLLPRLAARPDLVVLGSDFPNIPYAYPHQLEALERLGFGAAWLRAVCWDNGVRLVGRP